MVTMITENPEFVYLLAHKRFGILKLVNRTMMHPITTQRIHRPRNNTDRPAIENDYYYIDIINILVYYRYISFNCLDEVEFRIN
jgi:hypothetical protein